MVADGTTRETTTEDQPPSDTGAETSTAPSPVFTLRGRQIDLRQMGNRAYAGQVFAVLTPEEQAEVQRYVNVLRQIRSIYDIELPQGVTLESALDTVQQYLQRNNGSMPEDAPEYVRQLWQQIGTFVRQNVPGADAATGAAAIMDTANTALTAWYETLMTVRRAVGAVGPLTRELTAAIPGGGFSEDQAFEFATAYVAARVSQGEARRALPFFDINILNPSQLRDNLWPAAVAGIQWLGLGIHALVKDIPGVNAVVPGIVAIMDWFGSGCRADFGQLYEQAVQNLNHGLTNGDLNYERLFESQLQGPERDRAAQQLTAVDSIGGVPTRSATAAIRGRSPVVTRDGEVATVTPGDNPDMQATVGPDGQPITPVDRAGEIVNGVFRPLQSVYETNPVGAVAGTVMGGQTLRGVAEGVWNGARGNPQAYVQGSNWFTRNIWNPLRNFGRWGGHGVGSGGRAVVTGTVDAARNAGPAAGTFARGVSDGLPGGSRRAEARAAEAGAELLEEAGRESRLLRVGGRLLGRAAPVVGGFMSGWEGLEAVGAARNGDTRGAMTHGADAAVGAIGTAGLFFGPPGWIVSGVCAVWMGLGLVGAGPSDAVGAAYDGITGSPQPDAAATTNTDAQAREGLDQAARDAETRAQGIRITAIADARDAARPLAFASVTRTSYTPDTDPNPGSRPGGPAPGQLDASVFGVTMNA